MVQHIGGAESSESGELIYSCGFKISEYYMRSLVVFDEVGVQE